MKIKQSTFYAFRILYRIHLEEDRITTSKEIAEKEGISQGVTLKTARVLARAGMLHTHQGRGQVCGGFSLAKSIDEITMAEVTKVLEGLDIRINLDESSRKREGALCQACSEINIYLEELLSQYSIRTLFEGGGESSVTTTKRQPDEA